MITTLFINIGVQEMIILLIILLPTILLPLYCLIDLFKRDFTNNGSQRLLITLLIILAPFIGSLIYLLALQKDYPRKNRI